MSRSSQSQILKNKISKLHEMSFASKVFFHLDALRSVNLKIQSVNFVCRMSSFSPFHSSNAS